MKFKRIFVLILDSLGVGEARDAASYGSSGANTFKNIIDSYDLYIPNLKKLGFYNTLTMEDDDNVDAYYTIARPNNKGKDSVSAHYEIFGIEHNEAFINFEDKPLPEDLISCIEKITKRRIIGNKHSEANSILDELGTRHLETGALIIFTTNDSSIEIAAHEDLIALPNLYKYCEQIRKLSADNPNWNVAKIVARPFKGKIGNFKYTADRKDYVIPLKEENIFEKLKDKKLEVISIGKNTDIFAGKGISKVVNARKGNLDSLNKLNDIMQKKFEGLCICNLSDFAEVYGNNKDLEGFAKAIEELDVEIPMLLNKLCSDDLLIITSSGGSDPKSKNFAHTRENLPVIIFGRCFKEPKKLEILESLGDIGASIAQNFYLQPPSIGTSFIDKLK